MGDYNLLKEDYPEIEEMGYREFFEIPDESEVGKKNDNEAEKKPEYRKYFRLFRNVLIELRVYKDRVTMESYCLAAQEGMDTNVRAFMHEKASKVLNGRLRINYEGGKAELELYREFNPDLNKAVNRADRVITAMIEKFDMLPACCECRNNVMVSVVEAEDKMMSVCAECVRKKEFKERHEKLNAENINSEARSYRHPIFDKNAMKQTMRAVLKGGIVGMLLVILSTSIGLGGYFAGGIASFITVRRILRIHMPANGYRAVIGLVMVYFMLMIGHVIGFGISFDRYGFSFGKVETAMTLYFFNVSSNPLDIALILAFFGLGVWLAYFVNPDR